MSPLEKLPCTVSIPAERTPRDHKTLGVTREKCPMRRGELRSLGAEDTNNHGPS